MTSPPLAGLDPDSRAEFTRLLAPIAHDVSAAVVDPPAVARGDWLGPASHACERLEAELRGRLVVVLGELDNVLASAARSS